MPDDNNSANIDFSPNISPKDIVKTACPNFIVLLRFKATLTSVPIKCYVPRTNPAGVSFKTTETTDTLNIPMATGLSSVTVCALIVQGKTLGAFERGNVMYELWFSQQDPTAVQ